MGLLDDDLGRLQVSHAGRGVGGYEPVVLAAAGGGAEVEVLGVVDGPRADRSLDEGEVRTEQVTVSGMRRGLVVAGLGRDVRTGDVVRVLGEDEVEVVAFTVVRVEGDGVGVDVSGERVVRVTREVRQG